jgi:hypothetical protein
MKQHSATTFLAALFAASLAGPGFAAGQHVEEAAPASTSSADAGLEHPAASPWHSRIAVEYGRVCRNGNQACTGIGQGIIGQSCCGCGFCGWWSAY